LMMVFIFVNVENIKNFGELCLNIILELTNLVLMSVDVTFVEIFGKI